MTFAVNACRSLVPQSPCVRYVVVEFTAPPRAEGASRAAANLAFAVDRSGSMTNGKLRLAVQAAQRAIGALNDGDRFSVVTFDGGADVVVPSTAATPAARSDAIARLERLRPGGNTDLGEGWLRSAEQVGLTLTPDALGRCIVLTDGQTNAGIVDAGELAEHARALRARRVTTSTIGLGDGFNEFLLGRLAEAGGGAFYYASDAAALAPIFAAELGDVFSITARDVALVIDVPEDASVESLNDYARAADGAFVLGSLGGEQRVQAVFRVQLPEPTSDAARTVSVRVRDQDGVLGRAQAACTFTPAAADACAAERPAADVVAVVVALEEARGLREALEQNQQGDYELARQRVMMTIARLRDFGANDPVVVDAVARLERERERFGRRMSSRNSKEEYMRAYSTQKGRRSRHDIVDDADAAAPRPRRRDVQLFTSSAALIVPVDRACRALRQPGFDIADVLQVTGRGGDPRRGHGAGSLLSPEDEQRMTHALREQAPGLAFLIVAEEFEDRWFSHWHEHERVAVVSTAGFVDMTGLPVEAFIAYELLLHGLRARSARYDPHALFHETSRGCLFDFCRDKPEIAVKLQLGHICDECVRALADVDIDPARLLTQWQAVQDLAHPR